ncbi:shikimate dehydrogenase [uncultured Pseudacidovorax sp.]|uniref:shikimate dehydrogenase family protein n=1 Tax=uncultured Pseudacidovorax sp. TaxID=679313 RepID=UPI0025D57E84|nr:shikimate dehydrogenase [uncultured Pseudacidovorax sp.]
MTDTPRISIPGPAGSTRLFVHVGHPIAQVQAPQRMNALFADQGVDAVMVALDVAPEDLGATLEGLQRIANLDGILVTVPHKFAACTHAGRHAPAVQLSGAANALRRAADGAWEAENFDGAGFVVGLRAAGRPPHGRHALLVGAGGAGVAIAASLVLEGVQSLSVHDLNGERARALVARLNGHRPGVARTATEADFGAADLVVQATPLGMAPDDPLPLPVEALAPHALVADIVMKPARTRLLEAAAARGLATHEGRHMLDPQIQMYADFFLGLQ